MSYEEVKSIDVAVERTDREFGEFFLDRRPTYDPATNLYNYVFFTSPDLSLTSGNFSGVGAGINTEVLLKNNSNFLKLPGYGDSIYSTNIVNMLAGRSGIFMPLLTNRATSFPASPVVLDSQDYAETWNKYKILMGTTAKDSRIGGEFEMAFLEDQNITVLKSMKLWSEYIEGAFLGDIMSAVAASSNMGSSQTSYFDYMSSMYHFVTRPDGKTLIYWAKYTGIYPGNIPYDVFQSQDGQGSIIDSVQCSFKFSYKEEMNIAILNDFNLLGSSDSKSQIMDFTGKYFYENSVNLAVSDVNPSIQKEQVNENGMPIYSLRMGETKDPRYPNGVNNNWS